MKKADSFCHSGFSRFINSPAGRFTRLVVGLVLITWGLTELNTATGIVLFIIGLIPFIAGAFDLCLVSALLGGPISGKRVRELNL
jgi:hypothetical protein